MTESLLLTRDACIAKIWAPESRPAPRTFEAWKKRRVVPYVKIGRLCFYSEAAVREAIATRCSINVRKTAA